MLNLQNAQFIRSAASMSDIPSDGLPQIVFAGRSNVGKSSVINRILGRRNLARTSSVPGKTANINIYDIDRRVYFIDLPGYGFARVAMSERERWGKLMDRYFSSDADIRAGVLVVDLRHTPTDDDAVMAEYLRSMGIPFTVCANKSDKVKKSELAANLERAAAKLGTDDITVFSASSGAGRDALLKIILGFIGE